jgi:acetyltransferase-like isoleucine patch superfamily enzyme
METDGRDYLYSAGLIGLVLLATIFLLVPVQGWLASVLGPYASIALFFLFAITYGGFTALVLAILSAWLPLREGDYAMNDPQFTLWKVQHVVGELGRVALSLFFPVFARSTLYALFGARIGGHVAIAGKIIDPRLTVLDDNCILGEGCIVTSHVMVRGRFILREVRVGKGATVGVGSILMPGVKIGPGAVVLPGSVLKAGTEVPEREVWGGVPTIRIRGSVD